MSEWINPRPLADEQATAAFAAELSQRLTPPVVVYLHGDLGAGKTALVRGFLRALGEQGAIKSPTYSLIESYQCADTQIHHLDLYRLADPEELIFLGLEELQTTQSILFIEWPEQGQGYLPPPTHQLWLDYAQTGRIARLSADFC